VCVGVSHFSNAKPKRLYRDASTWVLEVERLVPLDDRVLRPTMQKLVGVDVVLFQLANSDEGRSLVNDARRLMSESASETASYEVEEGRWMPAEFLAQISPKPRVAAAGQRAAAGARPAAYEKPAGLAGPSLEVHLLREEIRELRTAHEKLLRRVAHLERGGGGAPLHADGAEKEAATRTPTAAEGKAKPAAAAPAAAAAPEPKVPPPPAKAAYAITLPTPDALEAQISAIIGSKSGLAVTKKPLDLTAKNLWVGMMMDDANNVVGAMVANVESVVLQGGLLMLLPEHEIAEQLKSGEPNEAVTSAMSEIMNVSTAAFNAVPDNLHIRAKEIAALDLATAEWLKTPGPRLDLAGGRGAALTFVLRGEGT
jgi:hypothetical protein